jgi:tetratricopeptide (TPR) repeat protein
VIELLLDAENALALGLLDSAERTYRTVLDADPRNGIAAVGLSRVALERGDDAGALALAQAALEIDPDNATARRMIDRLEEVARFRDAAPVAGAAVAGAAVTTAAVAGAAVTTANSAASESTIRASVVVKVVQAGPLGAPPTTDVPGPAVPEHAEGEADHADGIQATAAAPIRALSAASAHESSTDSQRPDPDHQPDSAAGAPPPDVLAPSNEAGARPPNAHTPPTPPTPPARPGLLRRIFRRS